MTLRLSGLTYQQVADECGYSHRSHAREAVLRALDRYEAANLADPRMVENARLDRVQAAIWPQVLAGDLEAADTLIRLSARRARMNGLDAPQQLTISSGAQAAMDDALGDLRVAVLELVTDD